MSEIKDAISNYGIAPKGIKDFEHFVAEFLIKHIARMEQNKIQFYMGVIKHGEDLLRIKLAESREIDFLRDDIAIIRLNVNTMINFLKDEGAIVEEVDTYCWRVTFTRCEMKADIDSCATLLNDLQQKLNAEECELKHIEETYKEGGFYNVPAGVYSEALKRYKRHVEEFIENVKARI